MKTILITGVSRGIDYVLAKEFLQNNWNVIGITRRNNKPKEHNNFQQEILNVLKITKKNFLMRALVGPDEDVISFKGFYILKSKSIVAVKSHKFTC